MILRLIIALALLLPATGRAEWTYRLVEEFERPGTQPLGALAEHPDGNSYGTTVAGGASGSGTVFRVTPGGAVGTLVSFTGTGGAAPGAGPVAGLAVGPDGALYGTTTSGGAGGFGVAFKVSTAGDYTKLVEFTGASGGAAGSVPGELVAHADGNFYGTTRGGGAGGFGTVFRMTPAGVVTTLVEFTGTSGARKGSEPSGVLAVDGGTLFGVTRGGGTGHGTVFSVTTAGAWTLLAEFTGAGGARPGSAPAGGMARHSGGALYGTTEFGGANDFGVAFRVTAGGAYSVLRSFDDGTGSQPVGAMAEGSDGALYGVTAAGGAEGWGTVFRMTTAGAHGVLVDFTGEAGAARGAFPQGGLSVGSDGQLHGATSAGGPANLGVVFRVTEAGAYSVTANLSRPRGWAPSGVPVADGTGGSYFPMTAGGANGGGTLIRWGTAGLAVVADLGGGLGMGPDGGLALLGGVYYGVTTGGGASGRGTAFSYDPLSGAALAGNFTTSAGSLAEGALEVAAGAMFGVAREGGTNGVGTIYRLTPGGTRTRLVSFTGLSGAAPGARPRGPLVLASTGAFYGVTEAGGAHGTGVIFRLSGAGTYSVVAEFGATGPRAPKGGLVAGPDGMLYGTTSAGGGADAGCVIRIDPDANTWKVAGEFTGANGAEPAGELSLGPDGRIYGLAAGGGAAGFGTVFRHAAADGLEMLVSLTGLGGAAPGAVVADGGNGVDVTGGAWADAEGVVHVVVAGGGAGGGGVAFVLEEGTAIHRWKEMFLGDANAPDLGDPEHDGVVNLLEYALGLDPSVADAHLMPDPVIRSYAEGNRMAVLVPRNPAHDDITVVVEVSADLRGSWTTVAESAPGAPFAGPGVVGGDGPGPDIKSVEIRDLVNAGPGVKRFLRFRVVR